VFKRTAEERNIKKTNKIGMSVIGILLSIGVSVGATGVANAATVTQNTVNGGIQELASTTTISDAELDALVTRLDQLPESVKQANPQDIPNYATKLNNFLAGGTFSDTPSLASRGKMSTLGTNWPKCVLEIGLLVVQYGIPVAKVIKWVKEAKAIWGGGQRNLVGDYPWCRRCPNRRRGSKGPQRVVGNTRIHQCLLRSLNHYHRTSISRSKEGDCHGQKQQQ
jgi:hypothetical protein